MSDFLNILQSNGALLLMGQYPMGPLGGVLCTLLLSFLALLFSFPVGILVGVARLSPWRWLRNSAACWVYLLRGIPLMMVIFWTYFCVPLLTCHNVSGFTTMLCTLVLYESAYVAEIVRGGILALPAGQTEAARALGMGYLRTLLSVILPQALYNSLPSLISQLVSIVKDTSLGYVINVPELTYAANQVNNQLLTKPVQVFAIVALGYYLINFSLTWLAEALEKRITTKRQAAVLTVKQTTHPFPLTNT